MIAQNTSPTVEQIAEYAADFASNAFDNSSPIFKRQIKMLAGVANNYTENDSSMGYDLNKLILNSNTVFNGNQLSFLMKILEPTTDPPTVTYWEYLETEILESSLRAEEMPGLLTIVSV